MPFRLFNQKLFCGVKTEMESYIECCECGHQWTLVGDINLSACPGCKKEGVPMNAEIGCGTPPAWWKD